MFCKQNEVGRQAVYGEVGDGGVLRGPREPG